MPHIKNFELLKEDKKLAKYFSKSKSALLKKEAINPRKIRQLIYRLMRI